MTESIIGPAAEQLATAANRIATDGPALPATEATAALPEPVTPQLPGPPAPARATRVPPPPSARRPVLPSTPVVSPPPPSESGSLGNATHRSVIEAGSRQPRRHRSRRSVAAIAGWVEPAEIPDDAPGRVGLAAGEPPPASPPLSTAVPGAIRAPDSAALRGGAKPPGVVRQWASAGWPVVAVLCVVLIVVFLVGMRLTR